MTEPEASVKKPRFKPKFGAKRGPTAHARAHVKKEEQEDAKREAREKRFARKSLNRRGNGGRGGGKGGRGDVPRGQVWLTGGLAQETVALKQPPPKLVKGGFEGNQGDHFRSKGSRGNRDPRDPDQVKLKAEGDDENSMMDLDDPAEGGSPAPREWHDVWRPVELPFSSKRRSGVVQDKSPIFASMTNADEENDLIQLQLPAALPAVTPERVQKLLASSKTRTTPGTPPLAQNCGNEMKAGFLGFIRVHASGKVVLHLGDSKYAISRGVETGFVQQVTALRVGQSEKVVKEEESDSKVAKEEGTKEEDEAIPGSYTILGAVTKRAVGMPEL
mmetsp:Transcript_7749/g.9676  ORF Transcript_7749/g.9676 Transcript_7749/m.9676 type:complete len:331 (-) Transcript_7749:362-1354(-)|eukprot:CAMPEP_0185771796 /NCGR_PEP_ID=MMETSP1174-20130828/65194_1 /TAXON_ID=35687 /ORGANISM="Dictyocha speculum, Strain CCMP1381" /LENGTH=330 /DNA_ID=CAMNT_0028457769 /DNA_START=30 /DNA_END=1022 /DNA_ORIENTATION=-